MKLIPDCIRDILLSVEEATGYSHGFELRVGEQSRIPDRLLPYDDETLLYHFRQCNLSGFFLNYRVFGNTTFLILVSDLTPAGHEFIGQIRPEPVWKKSKTILEKAGTFTIDVIKQVATPILATYIKSLM